MHVQPVAVAHLGMGPRHVALVSCMQCRAVVALQRNRTVMTDIVAAGKGFRCPGLHRGSHAAQADPRPQPTSSAPCSHVHPRQDQPIF